MAERNGFGAGSGQGGGWHAKRSPGIDSESLGKLFDRLPPHSLEAERALLGCLLLEPGTTTDILGLVSSAEQFYSAAHGLIFQTLIDTYDRHQSGDVVQLTQALRDAGALSDVGGEDYLVQLADTVPSAANARHYARIIADKARLRRLVHAAGTAIYDAYNAGDATTEGGVREVLDKAEQAIFDVAQDDQSDDPQSLKQLLDLELERLDNDTGAGISGIPTGYFDLDEMLRGLNQGEMVIVAARPSMGKTALALNLAEQIALGGRAPDSAAHRGGPRAPVGLFSLEMSKTALVQRLLSAHANVLGTKFRDGSLSDAEHARVVASCNVLSQAPLFIDDTPGQSVMQLRARARRMVNQFGIRVFMIDYLQLLSAPGSRESRQVEVSEISRQVKALARELKVPIVCLSQLNRASESREGNRPRMSDLRESGSLEQDADVVMLLHREEYYHLNDPNWADENPDRVGLAELIVAKQRNGPTGTVRLTWDASCTRFRNRAERDDLDAHDWPDAPAPPTAPSSAGAFAPGARTGPVEHHRDGGGPLHADDPDDTGDVPF